MSCPPTSTPSSRGSTANSISRRRSKIWRRRNFPSSAAGSIISADAAWPRSFFIAQTCHQSFHLAGKRKGFQTRRGRVHSRLQCDPLVRSGMTFWAVSDLNEKELMEFVQDPRCTRRQLQCRFCERKHPDATQKERLIGGRDGASNRPRRAALEHRGNLTRTPRPRLQLARRKLRSRPDLHRERHPKCQNENPKTHSRQWTPTF
jgi:hypothetical protein